MKSAVMYARRSPKSPSALEHGSNDQMNDERDVTVRSHLSEKNQASVVQRKAAVQKNPIPFQPGNEIPPTKEFTIEFGGKTYTGSQVYVADILMSAAPQNHAIMNFPTSRARALTIRYLQSQGFGRIKFNDYLAFIKREEIKQRARSLQVEYRKALPKVKRQHNSAKISSFLNDPHLEAQGFMSELEDRWNNAKKVAASGSAMTFGLIGSAAEMAKNTFAAVYQQMVKIFDAIATKAVGLFVGSFIDVVKLRHHLKAFTSLLLDAAVLGLAAYYKQWAILGVTIARIAVDYDFIPNIVKLVLGSKQLMQSLLRNNVQEVASDDDDSNTEVIDILQAQGFGDAVKNAVGSLSTVTNGVIDFFSTIFSYMLSFFKSGVPELPSIKDSLIYVNFFNSFTTASLKFKTIVDFAFRRVYLWYYGVPYLTPDEVSQIRHFEEMFEAFQNIPDAYSANQVGDLHRALDKVAAFLPVDSLVEYSQIIKRKAPSSTVSGYLALLNELLNEAKEKRWSHKRFVEAANVLLGKHAQTYGGLPILSSPHHSFVRDAEEILKEAIIRWNAENPKTPSVMVGLEGLPRIGKDTLGVLMPKVIYQILGESCRDDEIYNFATGSNFQSYNYEKVLVLKDLFQVTTPLEVSEHLHAIWTVRDANNTWDAAGIAQKGTLFDRTELAIYTMNGLPSATVIDGIADPQALAKTFNRCVYVVLNPAGSKDGKLNYKLYTEAVDHLAATGDFSLLNKIWSFYDEKPTAMNKLSVTCIDFSTLCMLIADDMRNMRSLNKSGRTALHNLDIKQSLVKNAFTIPEASKDWVKKFAVGFRTINKITKPDPPTNPKRRGIPPPKPSPKVDDELLPADQLQELSKQVRTLPTVVFNDVDLHYFKTPTHSSPRVSDEVFTDPESPPESDSDEAVDAPETRTVYKGASGYWEYEKGKLYPQPARPPVENVDVVVTDPALEMILNTPIPRPQSEEAPFPALRSSPHPPSPTGKTVAEFTTPTPNLEAQVRFSPPMVKALGLHDFVCDKLDNIEPGLVINNDARGYIVLKSFLKKYNGPVDVNLDNPAEVGYVGEFLTRMTSPVKDVPIWLGDLSPIPDIARDEFQHLWVLWKAHALRDNITHIQKRCPEGINPSTGLVSEPRFFSCPSTAHGAISIDEVERALFPTKRTSTLWKWVAVSGLALSFAGILVGAISLITDFFQLYAQAKSEYAEYSAVPTRVKRAPPGLGPVVHPQGVDSNVLQTTLKGARDNSCWIVITPLGFNGTKPVGPSGSVLRVEGSYAVTAAHVVLTTEWARFHPQCKVYLYTSKPQPYVFDYGLMDIVRAGDTDLAVIKLPALCGPARSITKHIANTDDVTLSAIRDCYLVCRDDDNNILSTSLGDCLEVHESNTFRFRGNTHTLKQYTYRFHALTSPGQSGGCVYSANTRFGGGSRLICGIHLYGNTQTKIAMSIPFTLELYEHLRDGMKAEFTVPPIADPPPLDEAQCGTFLDGLPIIGQLPKEKRPFINNKTEIRPSLLQRVHFKEPVTGPARLRGTKTYEPMRVASSYIVRQPAGFPIEYVPFFEQAADNMAARIGLPLFDILPTWHETINGMPMYDVPRIDPTASVGFTGFNNLSSKRQDLFVKRPAATPEVIAWMESHLCPNDPDDVFPIPALMNQIKLASEYIEAGVIPPNLVVDSLKDERRPLAKRENPRLFSFYELAAFLAFRRYTIVFSATISDPARRVHNGMLYGIQVQSQEWAFFDAFRNSYDHCAEWDQEKFDKRLHPQLTEYLFRGTKHLHPGRSKQWSVVISSYWFSYVVNHLGIVLFLYHRANSGFAGTTPFNCGCSSLLSEACILWHQAKTGERFQYHCLAYGDDTNVLVGKQGEHLTYGFSVHAEFQKPLGMSISSPAKDGKIVDLISPRDAVMLKRTTLPYGPYILCPLPLSVIHETALWILDGKNTDIEATEQNAGSSLRAMAEYGREAFNNYKRELNFALREAGCQPLISLTWDEVVTKRFAGPHYAAIESSSHHVIPPSLPYFEPAPMGLAVISEKQSSNRLEFTDALLEAQSVIAATSQVQQGNIMAPVNSDALPVSQVGITSFVSGTAKTVAGDQNTPGDPRGPNPYEIDELTKALTRSYLVGSVAWTSTQPVGTSILTVELPIALSEKPFISAKLEDFYYFNCDGYDVTITYPSNPSYAGTLVCSRLGPITPTNEIALYNANPILIAAGRNEEIKFFIPNACPRRLMLTSEMSSIFYNQLIFTPIGQLLSSTDPDATLNVSVFVAFRNPKVIAPEPRGAIPPMLHAQSKDSFSESLEKTVKGVIGGVTNAVGGITGIMEGAAPLMEGILPVLAKPGSLAAGVPSVVKPVVGFSNIEGVVEADRLSAKLDTLVANKDKFPGLDPTMTLVDLARKPGYIGTYNVLSTASVNDIVCSQWLAHTALASAGSGPGSRYFTPTYASAIALHHMYSAGDIQYLIFVDMPATSSVTLSVAWWPDPATPVPNTEPVGGDLVRSIHQCTGPTVIKRRFPMVHEQAWLETSQTDSAILPWAGVAPNSYTTFGQMVITVVQPPTSMGGTEENLVRIYVYGSACKNFAVQYPADLATAVEYGPPPIPSSSTNPSVDVDDGYLDAQCDLSVEFAEDFETCIPSKSINTYRIFEGENFAAMTLSSLFKMPTFYVNNTTGGNNAIRWVPGDINLASLSALENNFHTYVSRCFLYQSGSWDLTFVWDTVTKGNYTATAGECMTRKIKLWSSAGWDGVAPLAIVAPQINPVATVHVPWLSQSLVMGTTTDINDALFLNNMMGVVYQNIAIGGIRDTINVFVAGGEDFAFAWLQWPETLYWVAPAVGVRDKRDQKRWLKMKKTKAPRRLKGAISPKK